MEGRGESSNSRMVFPYRSREVEKFGNEVYGIEVELVRIKTSTKTKLERTRLSKPGLVRK